MTEYSFEQPENARHPIEITEYDSSLMNMALGMIMEPVYLCF